MDTNFKHKEEEELAAASSSEQEGGALEFATAEKAIQHDREGVVPPVEIAERLNQSLANEPKLGTSFWTKLGFKK